MFTVANDKVLSLRLLTKKEVAAIVGVTERTIEIWSEKGRIPAPVKVGSRLVRWPANIIEQWIAGGMKPTVVANLARA